MTINKQQTRQGAQAGATPTPAGAASDHATEAGNNTRAQDSQAAPTIISSTEAGTRAMYQAIDRADGYRRKVAQSAQQATEDESAPVALAEALGHGLLDMHHAVTDFSGRIMQANLRAALEVLHLGSPHTFVEVQQRCVQHYAGALAEGRAGISRAVRWNADEAWRPLEEGIERRRPRQDGRQEPPRAGRVGDVMSRGVRVASPEDTVQRAAQMMREDDTSALPVGENDRLIGMVTGRDMAIRLVADARDPAQTKVREVMTPGARYVFEDEDLQHAAETMTEQHVQRLPVVSREKRLVGILSLGDVAPEREAAGGGAAPLAGHMPGGAANARGASNQPVAAE